MYSSKVNMNFLVGVLLVVAWNFTSVKADVPRSVEHTVKSVGLRIRVLTYNINEKGPPKELNKLLDLKDPVSDPDIYAIGLQEVNPVRNPLSDSNEKLWLGQIESYLSKFGYVEQEHKSIHGSLLALYVRETEKGGMSGIESRSVRLGVAHLYGNKGATAIRFDYMGTSFCFINSHLAAHEDQLPKRIENFQEIEKYIVFNNPSSKTIRQHDFVFWFGDLNFRIDAIPTKEVISIIENKKSTNLLLENDQLTKVIKEGKAFPGYIEGKPQFYPTFKFIVGTNQYNLKRKPAYTDRILYRIRATAEKLTLKQIMYKSDPSFQISDHKPVSASFVLRGW